MTDPYGRREYLKDSREVEPHVLDGLELTSVSLVPPEAVEGFQGGVVEVPDEDVRTDGGGVEVGRHERLRELRDPSNYEFGETPYGEKIHIVGTGLPPSMLVLGRQAEGTASEDADKALCGVVSEFENAEDVPGDPGDDLRRFCSRCSRQAAAEQLLDRGKFEEVPL